MCYLANYDIYSAVGNYWPVSGFSDFTRSLSNEEFVLSNCTGWKTSPSWVLRDLYQFLTVKEAALNTVAFMVTQAIIAFAFFYALACLPFAALLAFLKYKRR